MSLSFLPMARFICLIFISMTYLAYFSLFFNPLSHQFSERQQGIIPCCIIIQLQQVLRLVSSFESVPEEYIFIELIMNKRVFIVFIWDRILIYCRVVVMEKGKKKNRMLRKARSEEEPLTNYDQNTNVNSLYKLVEEKRKIPGKTQHRDMRRLCLAQEENVLAEIKACNLENQFYETFRREIASQLPVWEKIDEIQKLSNEEAVHQLTTYHAMQGLKHLELHSLSQPELSIEEEDEPISSEHTLNANMFEDNNFMIDGQQEQIHAHITYEHYCDSIFIEEHQLMDSEVQSHNQFMEEDSYFK